MTTVPGALRAAPAAAGAALGAPVRELLVWVAFRPRTYADAMAAWRSTCPRYTPWEDALDAGLLEVVDGRDAGGDRVRLTPRGHARLAVA